METSNQVSARTGSVELRNPVAAANDMIREDVVMWSEDVFSSERGRDGMYRWLGKRTIKALVERGFALGAAATHLVHLRVIASSGCDPVEPRARIPRTVSKLQCVGIVREAWGDDTQRRIAQRDAMKAEAMLPERTRQVEALVAQRTQPVDCTRGTTMPKSVLRQCRKTKRK